MQSATTATRREPVPLNGVDTPNLLATINVVKDTPELARFHFVAQNRWLAGTHSETTIHGFTGAGGEQAHKTVFRYDADHPAVLVGGDHGPTPVEFLLHALVTCITAGIGNIAAVRQVQLTEVLATVEGDIDLRGILGLSKEVRNGFQGIRVSYTIRGDAPPATLRGIVEQARARSAVYDVITNQVPVHIAIDAGE